MATCLPQELRQHKFRQTATGEANISAQQKARIVKLFVNYTGQMVEKGEKLAVLDVRYNPELTVTLDDLKRARYCCEPPPRTWPASGSSSGTSATGRSTSF